jgi:asparagine synthase (glutamine-hydrolysing)
MCGLAGLIDLSGRDRAAEAAALVRSMCELQAYRGPDDNGVVNVGAVCLGSLRLSIIDLSPAGHMPMSDASGRWWIAYNGEVYNFAPVREELQRLGHEFRSHSDTEVLLHAYMQWGKASIERFVGMFAFAICDSQSDEVVLVRDRYGKKPLYYARSGDRILFSSEMKALMAGRNDLRLDQQALGEWLLYRNIDALKSRTLVEGIEAVMPGEVVTLSAAGIRKELFYSPLEQVQEQEYRRFAQADPKAVIDEIDEALTDAVRLRLISDVPVGTLLSGGLDSSLVTAMAARQTKSLTAFHVSIDGHPDLDERRYAEQLATSLDIPFVPFVLKGADFRRVLPYVSFLEDLPLTHPNSTAYYLISKVAREHGVIVLQSGEGADELFGGYSWNYRRRLRLMRLDPLLRLIPDKLYSILELFTYSHSGMPVWAHQFRDLLPPAVDLMDRYARVEWMESCEQAYHFVQDPRERKVLAAMLGDIGDFLTPLLRRLDRTSMGASVEVRVPFLDHRLVHKAINMPMRYKVGARGDKWVLKQVATRYLPNNLIWRKKAGFPLPVDEYIAPLARREFFEGGFCQTRMGLSSRGMQHMMDAWQRRTHGLFGLIALEMWGRIHIMGQSVAEVEAVVAACESGAR